MTRVCIRSKRLRARGRCVRRTVHSEHHGAGLRVLGDCADGAFERAATNSGKAAAGERAGELVMDLLRKDVTPLKILTKTAIENAIAGVAATGARQMQCCICSRSQTKRKFRFSIDDFDRVSAKTPILADLKPGGRFVATDLYAAGGTALIAKRMMKQACSG